MSFHLTFEQARDFEMRLKTRLEHEAGWRDFFKVKEERPMFVPSLYLRRGDKVRFTETGKWKLYEEVGGRLPVGAYKVKYVDVDQRKVLIESLDGTGGSFIVPYDTLDEYLEKVASLNVLAFEVEDPWVGWLVVSVEGTPDADPEANRHGVTPGGRYGVVVYVEPFVGDIVQLYAWYAYSELAAVNQYDQIKASSKLQTAKTTWIPSSDVKKLRRIG